MGSSACWGRFLVRPQKRGAAGRQTRRQGRGFKVMLKDDQGWGSTEPRMTHLFAEERPLELGFEGQKVAGRPVEKPENAKTRGGEGIACLGSLAPPGGSPLWPRRMGSQGGRHCKRSLVQRPGDYLKGGRTQSKGRKRGTEFKCIGLHNPTLLVHKVSGTWQHCRKRSYPGGRGLCS